MDTPLLLHWLLWHSLWVYGLYHTHSLASFQWSGPTDQQALCLTESCLHILKWFPYNGRGVVSALNCGNKVKNAPASVDQGSSTATLASFQALSTCNRKMLSKVQAMENWAGHGDEATATHGSCHVHNIPCRNLPTSSYPTFFASVSKQIVPTDNM